ncbi:ABC transporter ATP-binding protein [Bacillus pumilus]|uniref:ABC transporter ATP-binding protein n=1 Tax=Bacillus pumilus TaxID=1408 RepID=UPI000B42FCF9|nr:ABC transporter ATP-binding protein [Bacillus pumilus]OUZ08194.1 glycine/betaine ABC transporter ATP-binding protein [Bacillus pumilus]
MIEFRKVSMQFSDERYAVESVDLEIQKGEFFVLIGPSGSGKTTTLKMINRLISSTEGEIYIKGQKINDYDMYELRWDIGYVLQQIALFPHMTIEENIAVVPELKRWSRHDINKRVEELMQMVGLDPAMYRHRKPSELSGGQQQRVGVARALVADPEIILMDEPFSALDPLTREKLQDDLLDLQRRIQKTIVFVTHDMQEAMRLGDRICIMKEGKVVQIGRPEELVQHPVNAFVREFVSGATRHVGQQAFELEAMARPMPHESLLGYEAITIHATLNEVLSELAKHEELAVEKDGERIGLVNRQAVIQFLADSPKERGESHE